MKFLLSVCTFVLMFIPLWVYLLADYFLAPEGFLEKFLLLGAGVWLFGGLQLVFVLCGIVAFASLLSD